MRLQIHKRRLRRLMLALVGLIAATGMLVAAQGASAAVTEAPDITASPSSPNTTHAVSTFEYEVGEGEASTATTLRFYCRVYDADATPPAAGTGWSSCGSTTSADPQPASTTYTQANGNWTFEVAVRETFDISTQGPTASSTWTQNLTAPSLPPEFVETPENPTDAITSAFRYQKAPAEMTLAYKVECRFDSTSESDWSLAGCDSQESGEYVRKFAPGNGEHTFEIRSINAAGHGPAASFTWTVDVPDIEPTVNVDDVRTARITGNSGDQVGGKASLPENLGDINDDGFDDLAIVTASSGQTMLDVFFGPMRGTSSAGSQRSEDGFRIPLPNEFGLLATGYIQAGGDQNGDGVDDVLITHQTFLEGTYHYVLYGGFDSTTLPNCPESSAPCLNLDTIKSDYGYRIGANDTFSSFADAGDFDGDGIDDLIVTFTNFPVFDSTVIKGVAREGDVSFEDIPANEKTSLVGYTGSAKFVKFLDDLDGDSKDEAVVMPDTGEHNIVYGRSIGETLDLEALGSADKLTVYGPAVAYMNVDNVGDMNGDGLDDLTANATLSFFSLEFGVSVLNTPERGSDTDLVLGADLVPGSGYYIDGGYPESDVAEFSGSKAIGDINNDGVPDFVTGDGSGYVDGSTGTGFGYVTLGKNDQPSGLTFGAGLSPDLGVGIVGANPQDRFGTTVSVLGDWDRDGLPEMAFGAPSEGAGGAISIVPGRNLINHVKTQPAIAIGNTSAVLNAGLSTNNRDSEVWFEYGTSEEYGQVSESREFEASNSGDAAVVGVDGLAKNTTYHYRAVAKNELGLVRYGDDRTFTTTNAENPGGDPCEVDPTKPGCDDYCSANPTAKGCDGYDWCGNNPGKCSTGKTKARLALIATQKRIAVKRGRKGVLRVAVVNTGGKRARGVKVCVKAPKRLVRVKRCSKVGKLASGKSRIVKVKVKVKRNARRGKKATLKFTASGKGVGKKKARARVIVR